tara:strand:+ start:1598 stop:1894 length:297 start_codon:yes stop_codon:yes gene_type:complete
MTSLDKYYKRKIERLWNGYASVKDYEVEKAIQLGGAVLTLTTTNETMVLSKNDLEYGLRKKTKKEFAPDPQLNEDAPFRLCNFFWKQQDKNQMDLINE